MIHDNFSNYWNGVKLMFAHQALRSDTARQRRVLKKAIATKDTENNHGVEAGMSQMALQRHRKRAAQDEVDQHEAHKRRKQGLLDEMHGLEDAALWESSEVAAYYLGIVCGGSPFATLINILSGEMVTVG